MPVTYITTPQFATSLQELEAQGYTAVELEANRERADAIADEMRQAILNYNPLTTQLAHHMDEALYTVTTASQESLTLDTLTRALDRVRIHTGNPARPVVEYLEPWSFRIHPSWTGAIDDSTPFRSTSTNSLTEHTMKESSYELLNLYNNLSQMYIGYDVERTIYKSGDNRAFTLADPDYRDDWGHHRRFNNYLWRRGVTIDYHAFTEVCTAIDSQRNRGSSWHHAYQERRNEARRRLAAKLAPNFHHRSFANEQVQHRLWCLRATTNAAVKAAIAKYGKPSKLPEGPQRDNAIALITCAVRAKVAQYEGVVMYKLAGERYAEISRAMRAQYEKMYHHNEWKPVVWANEPWYVDSVWRDFHSAHVSTDDPTQISYTQSADKLMRDIQTRTKPGRYLQQFFGDVLTAEQIREWAQRQVEVNQPVQVTFIDNKSPDLWVWAYENGTGFSSCMVYNHPSERYIHRDLHGDNHPVRIYCHPDNDLALAVIGANIGEHGGRVYARAIVNQRTKKWVRLYGDDRLKGALMALGYSRDGSCINGQLLTCKEYNGTYIMPYLDGDYTNVELTSHKGEDVFRISYDGEYDAQNSNGLMGECANTYCCDHCGERVDEDDTTYIESDLTQRVCSDCLSEHYREAYGAGRYIDYYPEEDVIYCETNGQYYLESTASNHNVYQCADSGNWYKSDDLVLCEYGSYEGDYVHRDSVRELPDGEYCHEDDYDDVMARHFADEEEEDDTEDVVVPAPFAEPTPAGDERFAIAA